MSSASIYLDESGDLGWTFSRPYRNGGSSRYLTIASLVVTPDYDHLPSRLIRKLYKKFKWPASQEKKWSRMKLKERVEFASRARDLLEQYPEAIRYYSITVRKQNVFSHIKTDANKLYNYMIGLSLLDEMASYQTVTFVPDPRSVKVESGNSLHDYLQIQLWFQKRSSTLLTTQARDSAAETNVQFADMLSGVVQGHFEDGNDEPWNELSHCVRAQSLYFND